MEQHINERGIWQIIQKGFAYVSEAITIADYRLPDNPLIYASPGFYKVTGYQPVEVIGLNCRFLQGPDTRQEAVDKIRAATSNGDQLTVELLNYRKDATPFWNRLSLIPVFDENEVVTHYVGIQSDITDERKASLQKKRMSSHEANLTQLSDLMGSLLSSLLILRENLGSEVSAASPSLMQLTHILEKTIAEFKSIEMEPEDDVEASLFIGQEVI